MTTDVPCTIRSSHLHGYHRADDSQLRLGYTFAAPALPDPREPRNRRKSASIDEREAHEMVAVRMTTANLMASAGRE